MSEKFQFVTIEIKEIENPLIGYYCKERVTKDDIKESSELPEDIKSDAHVYDIRKVNDGTKYSIEPKVVINFGGSFVTSTDISESMKNAKGNYLRIKKFHHEKQERV